jgi:hypothetical protein
MNKLSDILKLANVKVWSNGYSYDTQTNRCDIQDCYMQSNEEDVKPYYDSLGSEHRKILAQVLSQVLHYDDFTKFLSLTVIENAKGKIYKNSLAWVQNEIKNTYKKEEELKKENEKLKEDGMVHDLTYRVKQIKELVNTVE